MKFHIVKSGDNKEKIAKLYNMDLDDIYKLNPTLHNRELIVGEKIRVDEESKVIDDISDLYTSEQGKINEEEKYICPHCKNIIIIPKR